MREEEATDWRGAPDAADSVDLSAESVYRCATMIVEILRCGDEVKESRSQAVVVGIETPQPGIRKLVSRLQRSSFCRKGAANLFLFLPKIPSPDSTRMSHVENALSVQQVGCSAKVGSLLSLEQDLLIATVSQSIDYLTALPTRSALSTRPRFLTVGRAVSKSIVKEWASAAALSPSMRCCR